MQASQKAKEVLCSITAAAKAAAVKLPQPATAVKPEKECGLTLCLYSKSGTASAATGASATQSTADQMLGATGLLSALVIPFAPVNKHIIKEAVDKMAKVEQKQDRNDELKTTRSKLSILTALTLARNELSLPVIKLPAAKQPLVAKVEKQPLQPATLELT